jgi:hypothetical protein
MIVGPILDDIAYSFTNPGEATICPFSYHVVDVFVLSSRLPIHIPLSCPKAVVNNLTNQGPGYISLLQSCWATWVEAIPGQVLVWRPGWGEPACLSSTRCDSRTPRDSPAPESIQWFIEDQACGGLDEWNQRVYHPLVVTVALPRIPLHQRVFNGL